MTKGTIWTEPTAASSWLGFHLAVLLVTHATIWALSIAAYIASPPDAVNAVIFVYAILLALPTFAFALCMVLIRVTSRRKARPDVSWRRTVAIGNSIIVGLHALVVLWAFMSWLAA